MSSPTRDMTIDQSELLDLKPPLQTELSSSTGKSSRTSISFITNDQDQRQQQQQQQQTDSAEVPSELPTFDAMDEDEPTEQIINDDDEEEGEIDPEMTLKQFIELYLTGPRSMKSNMNLLLRQLIDTREGFTQLKFELQNSKNDISVIHSQFLESKRNHQIIANELADLKLESEKLKSDIMQLRVEHGEKLNEINFKMEQLSRMMMLNHHQQQQQQQQGSYTPMHMTSPMQFYPHPPPPPPLATHHYVPSALPITQHDPVPESIKLEQMDQYKLQQLPPPTTTSLRPPPPPQQQLASIQTSLPPPQSSSYVSQQHEFQQPNSTRQSPISERHQQQQDNSNAPSPITSHQSLRQQQDPSTSTSSSSVPPSSSTFKYALLKQITSIRQIWQEYAYGLNGQPSIKSLQIKYKTKWRYPEDASTFKRRKRIYKAIEIAMLNGLSEDEAITELENHRLDKEGNYRRSLQWLCDNIPDKFKGL